MYKLLTLSFIASLVYFVVTGFHSFLGFWWVTISFSALLMMWLVLAVTGYIGMMAKKKWDESNSNKALNFWFLLKKNTIDAEAKVDKNDPIVE